MSCQSFVINAVLKVLINVRFGDNAILSAIYEFFITMGITFNFSFQTEMVHTFNFLSTTKTVQVTCRLVGVILEESTPEELQVVTFIFQSSIYENHH